MAFYLRFEHQGQDLYPRLRQALEDGRIPHWNRVRYEMFKRLGYFVTESSEHFSEYVPWFIKRDRPDMIDQFNIPLDEYIRRCEAQIAMWQVISEELEQGHFDHPLLTAERSHEYGSKIIHSLETGTPRTFYGNVQNDGLIDNLPPGCCVEVPCLVDSGGIRPQAIGPLPPHLAALMQTNINVQALTVEAALTGRRDHIYHAAMLDPHTAAELDLEQIWQLVDDLLEAHEGMIPGF
jgi:alpha-galactosidase